MSVTSWIMKGVGMFTDCRNLDSSLDCTAQRDDDDDLQGWDDDDDDRALHDACMTT